MTSFVDSTPIANSIINGIDEMMNGSAPPQAKLVHDTGIGLNLFAGASGLVFFASAVAQVMAISKSEAVNGKLTSFIISMISLTVVLYTFVPWSAAKTIDTSYYVETNEWNLISAGFILLQIVVGLAVGFTPQPMTFAEVVSSTTNFLKWLLPWLFPQTYSFEQWTLIICSLLAMPVAIIGFTMSRNIDILASEYGGG